MMNQIIETKFGKVHGVLEEGITVFKGVPYAAPPVGALRWAPPVDPEPWEGVKECSNYAMRAMQYKSNGPIFEPYGQDFYYGGYPESSEDCLYLNIATAGEDTSEKRPVFMWFHGGGLGSGHSYEIEFNPTVLAKKGVIVVTVGQRLNVFGYLALPQLSAEQGGISGNYGLMDEVKALDWVYENIAAFGGDPENITIGGQSGGTFKCGALVTCPKAYGKVKRVIYQTSLSWNQKYQPVSQGEQDGAAYIEYCGFDKNASLEELRAAAPEKFLKPFDPTKPIRTPGTMYCDGVWVENEDETVTMDKYGSCCDYLAGGNYGESAMQMGFMLGGAYVESDAQFHRELKELLGEELYEKYDCDHLFSTTDAEANHYSKHLAAEGFTGFAGNMKNRIFGYYRAKKYPGSKSYSYIFNRVTPGRPEDKGTARDPEKLLAWHSSELFYTFASLRPNVPPCRNWEEADYKTAETVSSYWANFIKTGDPNGEGLPFWPASDENYGWMELDAECTGHSGLDGKKDELLLEFTMKRENLPEA